MAMLDGHPPTAFEKEAMSSSRPPTCWPYKSTEARPIVMTSRAGFMLFLPLVEADLRACPREPVDRLLQL
jgi:hypothetical protein